VGGTDANAFSWPAHALIIFSYKADVFLKDKNKVVIYENRFLCGGSLIYRDTVLTAAHCRQTQISFKYDGSYYTIDIEPNKYFPTLESMFQVYLGIQNIKNVINGLDIQPGVRMEVGQVVVVRDLLNQK
jgi:secreted trypsin-like serine protease